MNLKISPPLYLTWLVTERCNLKCRHCYASSRPWSGELETDRVLKLVGEMGEIGVKYLHITGGEPLLRGDIFKILSAAREVTQVSLFTNLMAMDRAKARLLGSMDIPLFTSMDGASKKTHEAVRGPGSWDVLMRRIKMIREELSFTPIFSISRLNFSEAGEFVRLAEKIGASSAVLLPVMQFGRASNSDLYSDTEMCVKAIKLAEEAADELGFRIILWCIPFAGLIVKSKYVIWDSCRLERNMDIGPNDDVLLCDTLDIAVSNVREKSLAEAWMEANSNRLMREVYNGNLCQECPVSEECRGGCYARSYRIHGILNLPDPLCPSVSGMNNTKHVERLALKLTSGFN
ncbi:MAG: radical SAM/SPASM domain-containing protein [Thermoproteota archaeon]